MCSNTITIIYLIVGILAIWYILKNRSSDENYLDFLPTVGSVATGEGGQLLESDNLGQFDFVNNETCLQCWRDYANYNICAPYCTKGFTI